MPILGSQGAGTKGAPSAPTIGTATAGSGNASVTFTAPSSKLPITSYTVTSSPSGITGTGSSSPITVSGLTAGTSYTFTVTATNSNGTSAASSASNSATPPQPRAGYIAGGWYVDAIEKITFPGDTISTLAATLVDVTRYQGACGNGGVAGYLGGGINTLGGRQSRIDKITTNDTVSTLSATLSGAVESVASFANSGAAGYWVGGNNSVNTVRRVDKLTFSSDSVANLGTNFLPQPREQQAGFANSGTAGYLAGGRVSEGPGLSSIEKITFSSDSHSTIGATLSAARTRLTGSGMANSGTAGYVCSVGDESQPFNKIDKLLFSNETRSTISATLSEDLQNVASMANSGTAGYFAGGEGPGDGSPRSVVRKITFPSDTGSTLGASLATARRGAGAFSNAL
jgi:hypothetical protein